MKDATAHVKINKLLEAWTGVVAWLMYLFATSSRTGSAKATKP